MAIRKYAKRFGRAVGKRLRKRYIAPKSGGLRVGKIARDVMYLKSLVNSEKKRYVSSAYDQAVSQISATSATTFVDGVYCNDITPLPSQGVTYNTRNGASIRLCSMNFQFQIKQQTQTISPVKIKFYWVLNKGISMTSSNAITNFVTPNAFNTTRDYNSSLNPDWMKNMKILKTKIVRLSPDALTNQFQLLDFRVGFKFKSGHHVRFDQNSVTVNNGQMFLIALTDSGNGSAIAYTGVSTGLTQVGANTGINLNYIQTSYFYDN